MNLEDIAAQNPWWKNVGWEKEDPHLKQLTKYRYVYDRKTYLSLKDGVVLVYGPRQVGKTTWIKQRIVELVQAAPLRVFYLNCEGIRDRFELNQTIKTAEGLYHPVFIFLDEISAVEDWERAIKSLVDEGAFEDKQVMLTGSSSTNILKKAERLPGRMAKGQYKFRYYPLSFREVASLYGVNPKNPGEAVAQLDRLNSILYRYFVHGGFIRAINAFHEQETIGEDIFSIYSAWIDGELAKTRRSPETATHILDGITLALTNDVSWSALATGINHVTVAEYIETLKNMFVIDYLEKYRRAGLGAPKNKKLYFADPFLYWVALFRARKINSVQLATLDSVVLGKLAEMSAYSTLLQHVDQKTGENDFDIRRYVYFEKERSGEIDFIWRTKEKRWKIECKFGKIEKEKPGILYLTKDTLDRNRIPLSVFLLFPEESFDLLKYSPPKK